MVMRIEEVWCGKCHRPRLIRSILNGFGVIGTHLAGKLGQADVERLERHVTRCPNCGELRARFAAADAAFTAALVLESVLLRWMKMPFGSSLLVLAGLLWPLLRNLP